MSARVDITEAECLEELAHLARGDAPEQARTTSELAEALGVGVNVIRRALTELGKAGRLKVHRVERISIDGRRQPIAAWTILPAQSTAPTKPTGGKSSRLSTRRR